MDINEIKQKIKKYREKETEDSLLGNIRERKITDLGFQDDKLTDIDYLFIWLYYFIPHIDGNVNFNGVILAFNKKLNDLKNNGEKSDINDWSIQFAIAFGCGLWRKINSKGSGNDGLWERAYYALQSYIASLVYYCDMYYLGSIVHGYPKPPNLRSEIRPSNVNVEGESSDEKSAIYHFAGLIAEALTNPLTPIKARMLKVECMKNNGEVLGSIKYCDANESYNDGLILKQGIKHVFELDGQAEVIICKNTDNEKISNDSNKVPINSKVIIIKWNNDCWHNEFIEIEYEKNRVFKVKPDESITISLKDGTHLLKRKCSCGTDKCIDDHRLVSWAKEEKWKQKGNKKEINLWSFIANAVHGVLSSNGNIMNGAFSKAMYYPFLAQGIEVNKRLIYVNLLFLFCSKSNRLYSGFDDKCPGCGSSVKHESIPDAPESHNFKLNPSFILLNSDKATYEEREFYVCKCGKLFSNVNLFKDHLKKCNPQKNTKPRPTKVYVEKPIIFQQYDKIQIPNSHLVLNKRMQELLDKLLDIVIDKKDNILELIKNEKYEEICRILNNKCGFRTNIEEISHLINTIRTNEEIQLMINQGNGVSAIDAENMDDEL